MRNRLVLALTAALVLAACTAQGPDAPTDTDASRPATDAPGSAPVLVIAEGDDGETGLSVAAALGHQATDDLVTVTGALFIDPDGTIWLCDAIAESFPPQCGGERIEVEGLDLSDVPNLQEENNVRWSEAVNLFGSVE